VLLALGCHAHSKPLEGASQAPPASIYGDSIGGADSAPAEVHGALDKEVIRGVIRSHLSDARQCFLKGLESNPQLEGRVVVQFVIGNNGDVVASATEESSLGNVQVEDCIKGAVRAWKFPQPKGNGIVKVSYPFILKAKNESP
jgi:TonB family protein